MKRCFQVLAVCAAFAAAAGCAQRIYSVGTQNPEHPVAPARDLQVYLMPSRTDVARDEQLERKVTRLLQNRGCRIVGASEADVVLLYDYDMEALTGQMKLELRQGLSHGMDTAHRGGPFVHTLRLRAVDPSSYSPDGTDELVLWEGGAVMTAPTESTKFVDMVIVAAFERWGHTTDDAVIVRMGLNDARARSLRD